MILGGIQPFTMIDYPNKLAAVLFTKGCPLRCPYCQNPSLQSMSYNSSVLEWSIAEDFLKSRVKLLDAIVFSGGEPLVQKDLYEKISEVKEMGFLVGLHTSGVLSDKFKKVLPLVDWVGLDIKTLFTKYEERIPHSKKDEVISSLMTLLNSKKDYEVRTTLDPRVIKHDELYSLAFCLSKYGVKTFAIQEYHSFPGEKEAPDSIKVKEYFKQEELSKIKELFTNFIVRRS